MSVSVSPPRYAEHIPPWTRSGVACRGKSQPFMPSCAVRRVQCPTPCATVTDTCGVVTSHFFGIRWPSGVGENGEWARVDFVIACANLNSRGATLGYRKLVLCLTRHLGLSTRWPYIETNNARLVVKRALLYPWVTRARMWGIPQKRKTPCWAGGTMQLSRVCAGRLNCDRFAFSSLSCPHG